MMLGSTAFQLGAFVGIVIGITAGIFLRQLIAAIIEWIEIRRDPMR